MLLTSTSPNTRKATQNRKSSLSKVTPTKEEGKGRCHRLLWLTKTSVFTRRANAILIEREQNLTMMPTSRGTMSLDAAIIGTDMIRCKAVVRIFSTRREGPLGAKQNVALYSVGNH
jgi:hypothetical protein